MNYDTNKTGAFTYGAVFLLILLLTAAAVLGICDFFVPESITVYAEKAPQRIGGVISLREENEDILSAELFGIPFKKVTAKKISADKVYLGGDAVGVKFYTGGVMVVGFSSEDGKAGSCPAREAGLKSGDIIMEINGEQITSSEQAQRLISGCEGMPLTLSADRGGTKFQCKLQCILGSDGYEAGMWIRDSTAGIGTVSFVTPEGIFASLGHGICDVDTGVLMPLSRGTSVDIVVNDAVKGHKNAPGELKGSFNAEKTGELLSNTEVGLFGHFNEEKYKNRELVEILPKEEVQVGAVQIISTVDKNGPAYYDARIVKILKDSENTKNMVIEITDPELIEKTGGIVQGMSGSPIIQNGKLIGAVTHVFVNDPTAGYGIFIENMLNAAKNEALPKAA